MEYNQNKFDDLNIYVYIGNIEFKILYIRYSSGISNAKNSYHCHGSYELHFIPTGKGKLNLFDDSLDILPGTFYLTGPGVYHEQVADFEDPMSEYCINFDLKISSRNIPFESSLQKELITATTILTTNKFWFGQDTCDSWKLINEVIHELNTREICYYFNVQNLLQQLLINTIRYYSNHEKSKHLIPKKSLDDMRREIIDNYFNDTPFNEATPYALSELLGISERQLIRILLQDYGMTFKEKITNASLVKVKSLLISTKLNLELICEKVGFSNYNYLYGLFKKHENMTPNEFRKKFTKDSNH